MSGGRSGRPGTGDYHYRKSRALVLAASDRCWLCHHPGAKTADHVTTEKKWPRDRFGRKLPGFDDPANLRPAHGTMGNKAINPCPAGCGLCNQRRGTKPVQSPRSRNW